MILKRIITLNVNKRWYVFKIKDNLIEYRDRNIRKYIELSLVGKRREKEYTWDIVSGSTC